MVNANGGNLDGRNNEHTGEPEEHDSEATSREQLSDIEENESRVDSDNSSPDPGPSPDGALDEEREIKDAGPM